MFESVIKALNSLSKLIKKRNNIEPTIQERVSNIVNSNADKEINENAENEVVKKILEIIEGDSNNNPDKDSDESQGDSIDYDSEAMEIRLKEVIIAVCNDTAVSDKVTLKLLKDIIESERYSTKAAVSALNSKKSRVSDKVLADVLREYGKGFKPENRLKLLDQINDSGYRGNASIVLLDFLYDDCSSISDNDLAERITEMKKYIKLDKRTFYANIKRVLAKKTAENWYNFGSVKMKLYSGTIPFEELLEEDFLKMVEVEYNEIPERIKSKEKPKKSKKEKRKEKEKKVEYRTYSFDKDQLRACILRDLEYDENHRLAENIEQTPVAEQSEQIPEQDGDVEDSIYQMFKKIFTDLNNKGYSNEQIIKCLQLQNERGTIEAFLNYKPPNLELILDVVTKSLDEGRKGRDQIRRKTGSDGVDYPFGNI